MAQASPGLRRLPSLPLRRRRLRRRRLRRPSRPAALGLTSLRLPPLQALPPRLRAEALRYLRCTDAARAEERERLRPDPVMAAWVELLDELESGGPLMREVVRDTIDDST